jgi:hypothetical protein
MVVNRAKIQNFFSLKSTTWKMLARRAKIRGFPSQLCISEVFRMFFLPKSSTFWGLSTDTAKHNSWILGGPLSQGLRLSKMLVKAYIFA